MAQTATARQLYPARRTDAMSIEDLSAVVGFAALDLNTSDTRYKGMTRDETVLTAQQSWCDAMDVLHSRALAALRTELGERAIARFGGHA